MATRELMTGWTPEGTPVWECEEELKYRQQRDALALYKEIKEDNIRVRKELRKEAGIDEAEMTKYLRQLYFESHRTLGKSDMAIQKEIDMFQRRQYNYYNNMEKLK